MLVSLNPSLNDPVVATRSATPRCPTMSWLPIAPDFRGDLRASLDAPGPTDCLENLAYLASFRLGFLETVQLDRALGRLGAKEAPGFLPIRLAVLASSTIDHLLPAIRVAGLRRRLLIDVHSGAYGQYRQDLLDPTSSLHQFAPQTMLFSVTAREAIAAVPLTATIREVDETISRLIGELRSLWRKARENYNAAIIQQTFIDVTEPLFGDFVARILAAQRGLSKKCLVLDLDNTLWGGVVGDDGLDGIVLGEGSAVGEAHLALQRYAKQLKERGVILTVCSKNDPGIAEAVFREHPEMVLRWSDIAAFVANWDDKVENLKIIANRLNIGIDSLVFVDDNPVERARVRQSLPTVAVPELPDDAAQYVRCLAEAGYFEAVAFTSEDRQRAEQYAANAEREALLASAQSMGDFL